MHIVTVNPEMLLAARADARLLAVLQQADLRVADGFGLLLVMHGIFAWSATRITGNDVIQLLMENANENRWRVLLLGGSGDQAVRAAQKLGQTHPQAVVQGDHAGAIQENDGRWEQEENLLARIKRFSPDVLFVALGHGKQEKWLADFLPQLPSVRVGVGVGGAFAFLCGDIARSPRIWQRLGLEWLWRFLQEPWRASRIFRALVVFPLVIFWDTMRSKHRL